MRKQQLLIDGQWVKASNGALGEVKNPATGEIIAQASLAATEDIKKAIEAAGCAFPGWAELSPAERGAYLRAAGEKVMERHKEIGALMTEEQGKPLLEAQGEVKKAALALRYYAEEGERVYGRIIANAERDIESRVVYQPIGPAAAITPWNYPVELLAWKICGALAAGCTMVAKPPSLTPLSPFAFMKCLVDAGIPPGVINGINGPGSKVGRQLIENPIIKKMAFTGSTEVGRLISTDCGPLMKKASLELGGHCPMIISRNCDLEAAVEGAVRRSFRNMGQICISINRIYVDQVIHDRFVEKCVAAAKKLKIGHGLLTVPCDLGCMANAEGLAKTKEHIADAISKGANVACGGQKPEGKEFAKGFFFEPTILTNVNHQMKVMTEETFGPVVGVMAFDDLNEAIALANDTPYGLAAYGFTDNLDEADKLAREIHAGNVAINNVDAGVMNAPYGGWKDSGRGCEHGPEGLMEYLEAKHVRVRYLHSDR